jgi:uncharacterized membrane protein
MRTFTTISGLAIILFLINAMSRSHHDYEKLLIAWGALFVAVCLIIIKIPRPGNKKKRKGILKG